MGGIGHELLEWVPGFRELGIMAFTTTRQAGSLALQSPEPAQVVYDRWRDLLETVGAPRLAFAHQVHGVGIEEHHPSWRGILRGADNDGHLALRGHTAMAVSLADCVPVFVAHPSGVAAVLHSGWKGTAGRIVQRAVSRLVAAGLSAAELRVHCGPAICGQCYEVSPDVYLQVTGTTVERPTPVDLRRQIAQDAVAAGVGQVTVSEWCTKCNNDRFFSHRMGDIGRQMGVIVAHSGDDPVP